MKTDLTGAMVLRGMSAPMVASAGQAKLYFDSTAKKLRLSEDGSPFISLIGMAGGGVTLQGFTPGIQDIGHINVSGTGLFGGSLGVGTTNPRDKLEVVGNIRMSAKSCIWRRARAVTSESSVGGSELQR